MDGGWGRYLNTPRPPFLHGMGLDTHGAQWIMQGNEQYLESCVTFGVNPDVYLPGKLAPILAGACEHEPDRINI